MATNKWFCVITVFTVFAITATGFAQVSAESAVKGNLGGSVIDPSGAVVPGAKVTITGPTGQRTMNSDAQGGFMFQLLVPGKYSLEVEKQGFKKIGRASCRERR